MAGFVIEYNRKTQDFSVTQFLSADGHREALRRRLELESHREDPDVEIVSLVSDSLATVRKTHSRYFAGRELTSA